MSRILRREDDIPRRTVWQRISDIALTDVTVIARGGSIQGSLESLEALLLEADFGVGTTMKLVADVEHQARRGSIKTQADFTRALRTGIESAISSGNSSPELQFAGSGPTVILVLGVNGAGKTTFIGKLSHSLRKQGKKVLVGAADTFRAGAIDQLRAWAERTGAEFAGAEPGSDPAAVAFQAIDSAVLKGMDVVIVDTAGRLHTSSALMEELKKIHRVIARRLPGAPHESLLVLDGTIGQNAIAQARTFSEAIPLTGIVVTKLDGTARGGVVLAVHDALDIPVKFIGLGEKATDLDQFDARRFASSLIEG